jgi:hypothetical protein
MDAERLRIKASLGEYKTLPPWMFKPKSLHPRPRTKPPLTITRNVLGLTITAEVRADTANIKVREGKQILGVWSGIPALVQGKIIQISEAIRVS